MDLSQSDWEYVAERGGAFVGREWVFAPVRSFLSGPPGTFLLRGDPGTGKTAVAARLAQASCGHLDAADSLTSPVGEGVISAGVFCRVGKATVAELAQRLADQLAASVDGFADALQATAEPGVTIGDVSVVVRGDVHAGGTVSGVVLPRQDGTLAFSTGVAEPLRRLRERDAGQPIVLLVDAVDEAADVGEVNVFSRLLSKLEGVHLIVTCRPDPSVLSDFRAAAHKLDLIADAPADDDDVRRYIRNRLTGQGPEEPVNLLADRISGEADGNFLYAFYVTGTLIESGSLAGMDGKTARGLPLPTGGLAGVYEDFLDRQIAGDEAKWADQLSPVLAPLCVAFGDGLTTAQLAAVAGRLTGQDFSLTRARRITRLAGQFLDGPQPDGPFRVYHQSFTRFLIDPGQNQNWPIDVTQTNSAIVRGLIGTVPEGRPEVRDWANASVYVRRHLAMHAAAAGILDDLLLDPGYLLAADPLQLLPVLSSARTAVGRGLADVVRRASQHLLRCSREDAASYLELRARQRDLRDFADAVAQLPLKRRWRVRWAHWNAGAPSQALGVADGNLALSAVETGTGSTLALVGRRSGAVEAWDLALDESVARWHPEHVADVQQVMLAELPDGPALVAAWFGGEIGVFQLTSKQGYLVRDEGRVTAMCLAERAGQAVCVTAHNDLRLVMRTLPQLDVVQEIRGATRADIYGLAVVTHHGGRVLLSAGDSLCHDNTTDTSRLRMWSLDDLSLLWEDHLERTGVLRYIEKHDLMGRAVTVISQDWGPVQFWDLNQGTLLLEGDQPSNHAWVYEHDGKPFLIEVKSGDLTARHIEVRTDHEPPALALGRSVGPIETDGLTFSSLVRLHGRATLLSETGGDVRVWDLQDLLQEALRAGDSTSAARTRAAPVHALAWGKERPGELYAGTRQRVFALDAETGTFLWEKELGHEGRKYMKIKGLALAPPQDRLVAAEDDGCLHVLDLDAEGQAQYFIKLGGDLERLSIATWRGQTLAFATVNQGHAWGVRVWDLDRREEVTPRPSSYQLKAGESAYQLWSGEEDKVMGGLAVVPGATGVRFAFASKYGKVMVADLVSSVAEIKYFGRAYDQWRIPNNEGEYVNVLAASRGQVRLRGLDHALLLAAATEYGTVVIWNFLDGTLLARRSQPLGGIQAMQFGYRAGQAVLATGGGDGVLRVWTTELDELLRIEIEGPIYALTFLGSDRIAVGGQRGVLMLELLEVSPDPSAQARSYRLSRE